MPLPTPRKDPNLPDTEIYYCSKGRSVISLAAGFGAFALTLHYFLSPGPHGWLGIAFCGFFLLMGAYAVFCELRSLINPRAHCLMIGPDGLTLCRIGKPVLYAWADIRDFTVVTPAGDEKTRKLREPEVRFDLIAEKKTVTIDDSYGWAAGDLAAHLNHKKRKFKKLARQAE